MEPGGDPRAMQWSKPKLNMGCQICSPKPLTQQDGKYFTSLHPGGVNEYLCLGISG